MKPLLPESLFLKKVFYLKRVTFKILGYSESLFKKRLWHRSFPVNYPKFSEIRED